MWILAVPYSWNAATNVWLFPLSARIPLSYSVFIGSALCYGLISYANGVLSASITTSFWPLQVLVATTLASFCYDEHMSTLDKFGGVLIISGMLIITWGNAQSGSLLLSWLDKSNQPSCSRGGGSTHESAFKQ